MSNIYVYQPLLEVLVLVRQRRKERDRDDVSRVVKKRVEFELSQYENVLTKRCAQAVADWQGDWSDAEGLAEFLRNDLVKMKAAADPEWKDTIDELQKRLIESIGEEQPLKRMDFYPWFIGAVLSSVFILVSVLWMNGFN